MGDTGSPGKDCGSVLVHKRSGFTKDNKYIGLKEPAWLQVWPPLIFYLLPYWLAGSIEQSLLFKAYRGLNKSKQAQSI